MAIGSHSFPLQNLFSTTFRGQPFVSTDLRPRCTLRNRFSVPLSVEKAPKTASKLHAQGRSGPQRSKRVIRPSTLTGRPRARTPSSLTSTAVFSIAGAHEALSLFPLPFTVVWETWQPVLPVYTSQNKQKKATWCVNQGPGLQTCMQPVLHTAHASLHHLHAQ